MSPFSSLDRLLVSQVDFDRYNGHHRLESCELTGQPGVQGPQPIDLDTPAEQVAEYMRQPCSRTNAGTPTMKLVMIQTRNQSTARHVSTSSPLPPGTFRDHRPVQSLRQRHCGFVKDLFALTGLPLAAFGSYVKGHITFVCTPSSLPTDHCATAYYCSGTSWTITWVHYAKLAHTSVLLLHREGDGDDRKAEFLDELIRLQEHLGHPMLPGYIKTKISICFTFDMLDDMNSECLELEQEIGFPTWNWILDRETPGKQIIPESHDHAVGRFNVLSGKLTNIRFRLRTFQQQIKFISRCNKRYIEAMARVKHGHQDRRLDLFALTDPDLMNTGSSGVPEATDDLDFHPSGLSLNDTLNIIWDYTAIHLFDADTLAERLRNQMESIFQITAQRDSRANLAIADINNELAWQGRETNSAMMTIAFVSLLFLPGTFVAAVFDMMSDFAEVTTSALSSSSSSPDSTTTKTEQRTMTIKTNPLTIYWLTTGLLTLTLCLAWILYLYRRRKIMGKHKEMAVKGAKEKIYKRPGSDDGVGGDAVTKTIDGGHHVALMEEQNHQGIRGSVRCTETASIFKTTEMEMATGKNMGLLASRIKVSRIGQSRRSRSKLEFNGVGV